MTLDAVVVGAGVNGLTAAARLARAGRRVLVIERAETVGGNARTAELLVDGVRHDLGAAVVPFAAASPAFKALGLPIEFRHSPVAMAHPLDAGRAAVLHRDLDTMVTGLGKDGEAYRRLVTPFVRNFAALVEDVMATQIKIPRHPLVMARFGPWATAPANLLARRFSAAEARALLAGLGAHATVPPDRLLTGGVGLMLMIAAHTVGWPVIEGGTQGVAEALAAVVTDAGGSIEFGREIRSLDDVPKARSTLFDVTPRQFARITPGAAAAFARWKYGPGACKVDYVLNCPMPWTSEACRSTATVHVGGTAAEVLAAEREIASGRVPDRPFVLVAQPDVADPTRQTASGLRPLWTYCHVPNGSDVDASAAIERQLERFAPGWRDCIVAKRVLTARDSEATNPNLVGGDLAAGLMTVRQMLLGPRPGRSPYRTNVSGVYLCSSSCPPGPGIHGMAGWHAAAAVLRDTAGTVNG